MLMPKLPMSTESNLALLHALQWNLSPALCFCWARTAFLLLPAKTVSYSQGGPTHLAIKLDRPALQRWESMKIALKKLRRAELLHWGEKRGGISVHVEEHIERVEKDKQTGGQTLWLWGWLQVKHPEQELFSVSHRIMFNSFVFVCYLWFKCGT